MTNFCVLCSNADNNDINENKERWCSVINEYVGALHTCPNWQAPTLTKEEQEQIDKLQKRQQANKIQEIKKKVVHSTGIMPSEKDREDCDSVTLYEHQKYAREKFKDKNEIALFFEMGCGKTLTSMMIMCDKFKAGIIDSLLIVAPNDVHKQWFDDLCNSESTLAKAIEQENVKCVGQIIGGRGGQKEFYDFDYTDNMLHIVCVNIDTFSTPNKWKPIVDWANAHETAIIIDEATVIKNPTSKRAERMLYEFNDVTRRRKTVINSVKKHPVRVVLTGTPVTNGPMDLWAIMEFIKPNYFGRNYYSFMNYYGMFTKMTINEHTFPALLNEKTWNAIHNCNDFTEAACLFGCTEETYLTVKHQDMYKGPYKHGDELKKLLEPNAVFAKLTDCVDMPEQQYIIKRVSLSPAQESCYKNMQKDLLAEYDGHVATAKNKLTAAMRLQQISSGFVMAHEVEFNEDDDIPFWDDDAYDIKPDEVVWLGDTNPRIEQLLRDIDELDKPILVMTRFSAEADMLYNKLKDKYNTCLITGWKCIGTIDEFKQGKYDIMIANTTKIARGHNLQIAHSTIYYSNTFSMELRQQSEFRTFRIGQTYPCTYIDYISSSIDENIINALKFKKNFLEFIRDKNIEEVL